MIVLHPFRFRGTVQYMYEKHQNKNNQKYIMHKITTTKKTKNKQTNTENSAIWNKTRFTIISQK